MIFRLFALIALPVMAYYLVKSISLRFSLNPRQQKILFVIVASLLVVAVMVTLGRLPVHFILAPLGAGFAFLLRMLPTVLRLLPMWQMFKSKVSSAGPREGGQSSTIRTRYLEMALAHSSGDMDGTVLLGQYAKQRLSTLNLEDLVHLYKEVSSDPDSAQVLEAYIERQHPGWREKTQQSSQPHSVEDESVLSVELALEILGLDNLKEPPSRDAVIKAHRSLMSKMHPDRGGSDYLAKKINAAKEFLIENL